MLKSLWRYRNFVFSSIYNELFTQLVRSKLGGLWIIINPLSQVLIYALILSNILAAKLPGIDNKYAYAIYLMAGLLGWNLFSDIINRCMVLFIAQANIMKKMSFPRITLPVIAVGSSIANNLMLFIAILGIFALLGHEFSLVMLWLIPLTLLVVLFAAGLGLILGVMNVFVRDIGQGVTVILQVWFWFTPIIYPVNIIPERYLPLMQLNPMYSIVDAYHQILAYNQAPSFQSLVTILFIASGLSIFGLLMFRKASPEMVDVL